MAIVTNIELKDNQILDYSEKPVKPTKSKWPPIWLSWKTYLQMSHQLRDRLHPLLQHH